jgi:hypothetical protein
MVTAYGSYMRQHFTFFYCDIYIYIYIYIYTHIHTYIHTFLQNIMKFFSQFCCHFMRNTSDTQFFICIRISYTHVANICDFLF